MRCDVPVAFVLFNRPALTARTFKAIAEARPKRLFLIADGPRNSVEAQNTAAARLAVASIDWDCDVQTHFSDHNLGCRKRLSTGLDWVFSQCEEAIILEDDCLPEPSFFPFCSELLAKYRLDPRVSMISGDNFQPARRNADSYYFSAIAHVWGWATWRRVWQQYDVKMSSWPVDRDSEWFSRLVVEPEVAKVYQTAFDAVHAGRVDTWDAQWQLAVWKSGGHVALPNVNLVTNLGFGEDATHTKKQDSQDANLPTETLDFPLNHPFSIQRDVEADLISWRRSIARKTIA